MVFYQPGITPHNLPHDPFKSCVIPRPIGWISTRCPRTGADNLAPYSQFTNLTFSPPTVLFCANQTPDGARKDTVVNAEASGVFCWSVATWPLRHAVNASSEQVAHGVDEFERAGVGKVEGRVVRCAMVGESPVRFECVYLGTWRVPGEGSMGTADVVAGRVVGVYIDESVLTDGKVDVGKVLPIARCGYYEYAVVRETFEMLMPIVDGDERIRFGLEGSADKARAADEEADKGRRRGLASAGDGLGKER